MGKQEYAKLLEGIVNDADVAGRVHSGDFADLDSGELTDAERSLLSAAAGELDDDVSGFAITGFLKLGDIDGESWKIEEGTKLRLGTNHGRTREALGYLKIEMDR